MTTAEHRAAMAMNKEPPTIDQNGNEIPPIQKRKTHEWGPSHVGHGEMQCIHCLMTNREAAVLGPFCLP